MFDIVLIILLVWIVLCIIWATNVDLYTADKWYDYVLGLPVLIFWLLFNYVQTLFTEKRK